MATSSIPTFSLKTPTLFFRSPNPWLQSSVSNQTQSQNSIKWLRNKKIRSGSVRSTALMLQSAFLIASKLRIIPEPLDLMIRELGGAGGGGNGGGLGFRKDFGWGGFDGGGRRKKRKLGFLWVLVVGFGLGLWLILGKEIDSDVFRGVLGLSLFGVSVNGWKLGFKDWFLGFCCCAFLVGLGLNRENLQRWVKGFSSMDILRRRRQRRRGIWQWRS
ncbi:hypothetical protein LguiA_010970 [Lonicera macranthoides]